MSGVGVPHHAEKYEHKRIGVFIAIVAVIMAVIAALAESEANQMIVTFFFRLGVAVTLLGVGLAAYAFQSHSHETEPIKPSGTSMPASRVH